MKSQVLVEKRIIFKCPMESKACLQDCLVETIENINWKMKLLKEFITVLCPNALTSTKLYLSYESAMFSEIFIHEGMFHVKKEKKVWNT